MSDFKTRIEEMKQFETFQDLTVPDDKFVLLRLLGRNFAKLTTDLNIPPYDWEFGQAIVKAAQSVMFDLYGMYGYVSQGQAFVLIRKTTSFVTPIRHVERLVSLASAIATSTMVKETKIWTQFETRVLVLPDVDTVLEYFMLQYELNYARCARAYARHALLSKGLSPADAHEAVLRKTPDELLALFTTPDEFEKNFEPWKRYGIALYWGNHVVGYNPRLHKTEGPMSVVLSDIDLPEPSRYLDFLRLKIHYNAMEGQQSKDDDAFTMENRY